MHESLSHISASVQAALMSSRVGSRSKKARNEVASTPALSNASFAAIGAEIGDENDFTGDCSAHLPSTAMARLSIKQLTLPGRFALELWSRFAQAE